MKYLIGFVVLLLPATALAAYNDVNLDSNAVLQVGGYTLDIFGPTAAIQSLMVNDNGTLSVILASGSSIAISSPSLNQLSSDVTSDIVSNTCTGFVSSLQLSYSGAGTVTNTITPTSTICSGSGSSGSNSSTPIAQVVSVTSSGGSVSPAALALILVPSASTTAYLNSLKMPDCPPDYICTPVTTIASTTTTFFTRNLTIGSSGVDVRALQQYLNDNGFALATSGVGSPGRETTYFGPLTKMGLAKFQMANSISPAVGYFGPITRRFINSHL